MSEGIVAKPAGSAEAGAATPGRADAVLGRLSLFWREWGPAIPSWVAQELTFGQLRLLFKLHHEGGAATMSQIAEWLGVTLPTASGVVERLERHGLVERRHRLDDRRIVECALTSQGEQLLGEVVGMRDEATRRALSFLTPDELARTDALLTAVEARLRSAKAATTQEPEEPHTKVSK